jgi:hypothetical protein
MLKKKLHDYNTNGKPVIFPVYAVFYLINQVRNYPELEESENDLKFLLESLSGSSKSSDLKLGFTLDEPRGKSLVKWVDV